MTISEKQQIIERFSDFEVTHTNDYGVTLQNGTTEVYIYNEGKGWKYEINHEYFMDENDHDLEESICQAQMTVAEL